MFIYLLGYYVIIGMYVVTQTWTLYASDTNPRPCQDIAVAGPRKFDSPRLRVNTKSYEPRAECQNADGVKRAKCAINSDNSSGVSS
jgi:hypothetical protein